MKKHLVVKTTAIAAAVLLLGVTVMEVSAHARAGGGRSSGSRASRSYSRPASNYSQPSPSRQQVAPASTPFQQQQQRGGFLRSMAGGLMGGLLGGMLFSSLGFAGGNGMGGAGIGIFQILLLAGIAYLIYRFVKSRRSFATPSGSGAYQGGTTIPASYRYETVEPERGGVGEGLQHLRRMDPSFDESRFSDGAMDLFFKVQGAWMHRDLSPVSGNLTDEMKGILQEDLDRLRRERRVNRLENIAVRNVEITEVWQESGQDYVTALIHANLLDYTTDEATGAVVSGSKTDPVKFREYWTFTRPVGNNTWKLSAIQQES